MTIKDLFNQIQLNRIEDSLIVFKNSDTPFLANQYIESIASIRGMDVVYIDTLDGLVSDAFSLFDDEVEKKENELLVYYTDDLSTCSISDVTNLIIVTNKISSKEVQSVLSDYIVEVPKLMDWQIQDYAYSMGDGVDKQDIELLLSLYGKNILRLDQELSKLQHFSPNERKYLFKDMIKDGSFSDTTTYTVFNFTNAIVAKDIETLSKLLLEMNRMDTNPFGILTILLNNFRNLILVKANMNPTPENTGLDSKKLYAIKKTTTPFTVEQLTIIFEMLCNIDLKVKSGELPTEIMVDYIMLKILTM
jgi:DNA polymerase III delta subunit